MKKALEIAHSNINGPQKEAAIMAARGESGRYIKRQLPDRSVELIDTQLPADQQTVAVLTIPEGEPEDP